MQRNMDIIRGIILATAEAVPGEDVMGLPDIDNEVYAAHVMWLKEAGLVDADVSETTGPLAHMCIG